MNRLHELAWLTKFALTAASSLLLCAVITPIIAGAPQIEATKNDGEAAPVLIEFRNQPTPRFVLVGTSLTYRLEEQFFLPLQLRNLAIPGRSILNGLEIIASYPKLPAYILVESNIMTWPPDENFIHKFSYHKFSYNNGWRFQIAPPIRLLVAYVNRTAKEVVKLPSVDESILNRPPTDHDNKIYVERAKKEWAGHNQDTLILSNVDAVARIVKKIEARGSKVYFFELPLAVGMAETDVQTTTRTLFHQRFADRSRWLVLNYPIDQLRFADHAHLDERSALIVSRAMAAAILRLPQ